MCGSGCGKRQSGGRYDRGQCQHSLSCHDTCKSNLTIDLKDRKERVYSIVGWGQSHGEIIDNNDIVTTGNFNDGTLKQLQHTLWKGYDSKPSNLDNRALVSDTKHVNTTIAQAYINNQGQHVTITDAELYLTFLTERAGYLTSIGYYYYKTNEIPNSPDKVDKFIIIPNASIAGDDPYTGWSGSGNKYSRYDAPIQKNTKYNFCIRTKTVMSPPNSRQDIP